MRLPRFFGRKRSKTQSKPRTWRWQLEILEARRLLAIVDWTGGGNGTSWSDPGNWSSHALPGPTDDVVISAPAGVTIAHASGADSIKSLISSSPLELSGGTLTVSGTVEVDNTFTLDAGTTLAGATVKPGSGGQGVTATGGTLDGVTLDANLTIPDGDSFDVTDGLVLNATLSVGDGNYPWTYLYFTGTQALSGNGQVALGGYFSDVYLNDTGALATLTIDAGVTIHGAGQLYGNELLDNQGTIDGDLAGGVLNVSPAGLTNEGTLAASGGGALSVSGLTGNVGTATLTDSGSSLTLGGTNYVIDQSLTAPAGTTLGLNGTWTNAGGSTISGDGATLDLGDQSASSTNAWSNAGTISATNGSAVNLGGDFTLAGLASFTRSADSTLNLVGTLDLLPVAPSGLTATAGADFVGLNWSDNSKVASGYSIERSTDGVNFSPIGTVAAKVTSYIDSGLTAGTTYSYRVQAYNAVGDSLYSNVASAKPGQIGPGLLVSYYDSTDLSGTVVTSRVDATASDGWNSEFGSAVWLAQLQPQFSETYTFNASPYGYAKVWVGGQLVFNNLDADPANPQIALVAGQKYDLRVEYESYSAGSGNAQLYWASPSTPREIIPADALSLPTDAGLNLGGNVPGPVVAATGIGTLALDATTGSWNLAGGMIAGGTITASGGAALNVTANGTLNGVTLDSDLSVPDGQSLAVSDGLTLNSTLAVGDGNNPNSSLYFDGTQTLSGSGQLALNGPYSDVYLNGSGSPMTLTVAPGMTIEGAGQIADYYGNEQLDNQGTISADASGGTLNVSPADLTNEGTLEASGGGTLNVNGLTGNVGSGVSVSGAGSVLSLDGNGYTVDQGLTAPAGTTLSLSGTWTNAAASTISADGASLNLGDQDNDWTNAGTIGAVNGSTVNLGGEFTLAALGSFSRSADSTVNLIGTLDLLPVAPAGLSASAGADFAILNWADNSTVEAGYSIERSTDGMHFSQLGTVGANVTNYVDAGLTPGTTYSYRVQAYNAVGDSLYSNVASATPGQISAGLLVSDYDSTDLSGPVVTSRVDATASDGWNSEFGSAVWLAQLQPQFSETYTFDASVSGYVKVWVGGQLVVNTLDADPANPQVALVAGQKYALQVEYESYSAGYGSAQLYWTSPSTPREIIPADALSLPTTAGLDLGGNVPGPVVAASGIGTLALDATTGSWNLAGGTIAGGTISTSGGAALDITAESVLDGTTLDIANLDVPNGQLRILHGLTLANGSMVTLDSTVYDYGYYNPPELFFIGDQTLGGSGQVNFAGSFWTGILGVSGALTIAPGVTITTDGFGGYVYDFGGGSIVNQGTIEATGGQTLNVYPALSNQGTIAASGGGTLNVSNVVGAVGQLSLTDAGSAVSLNGAGYVVDQGLSAPAGTTLSLNGTWTNAAASTISADGATLDLGGPSASLTNAWSNAGTISAVNGSTVNLGGEFTLAELGSFSRSADSTVNLVGTLDLLPVAPSGLSTSVGADFAILNWSDNSTVEAGYSIERSTDGMHFSQLGTVGANVSNYVDAGLTPGATYSYRVQAYNVRGDSLYSNVASATPGQLTAGLLVSYYNSTDLSGPVVTSRVDATASDSWSSEFGSAVWLAQLQPQFSETYTFDASASGYVKVWVDGQIVYNTLDGDAANPQIALVAGQKYDLRVEYESYGSGSGSAQVDWSSPSTPYEVIPADALAMPTDVGLDLGSNVPGPVVAATGIGTLALDATTGSWNLAGGTVAGGSYSASGGAELVFTSQGGTLDGVTADSNLDLATVNGAYVNVLDGLTLSNTTVYLGNAAGSTNGQMSFADTETLGGDGTVLFGTSGGNALDENASGGTLTIGPNVTVRGKNGTIGSYYGNGAIINQGTISADDSGGGSFGYDSGFDSGYTYSTSDAIDTSGVTDPAPQEVYQTARQYPNFSYTLSGLTAGDDYTLRLHFADFQSTAAGQRVFNVSVNGTLDLADFDIFAAAGGEDRAVVEELPATADGNGQVTIEFDSVQGWAQVNGIEVLSGASVVQTINAGLLPGGTITINPAIFTNQATLQALNGATLSVDGVWTNAVGATASADGATLDLGDQNSYSTNAWSNAGAISAVNGSTLNLGGEFTLADSGSFSRSADSTVNLVGTLDLLPVAPSGLSASVGTDFAILNWSDNSKVASGYTIERSADGVHFSQIGTVAGNVGSYVDSGLTTGTTYYYRVRAYSPIGDSLQYSNIASATPLASSPGLLATYHNSSDESGPVVLARVEPTLDEYWGSGSPGPGVFGGGNWVSVEWQGQLQAQFSETYTFDAQAFNAVKVWVNGQVVVNTLDGDPTNAQIDLVAGQKYDLQVEYESYYGDVHLYWSSPSTPHEIIPADALFTPEAGVADLPANVPGPVVTESGVNGTLALDATTGSWNLAGGTIAGGTYTASGGAELVFTSQGGTLDGITAESDLDLATDFAARVNVLDGLTLSNSTIYVGNAAGSTWGNLYFANTETLGGAGTVLFGKNPNNVLDETAPGDTLTIGPHITVRGSNGTIGAFYGNGTIVNQGTIAADDSGGGSWSYDHGYSNYDNYTANTLHAIDTSGVTDPAPQEVYQTAREGYNGDPFVYTLTGLTANTGYTVRLHFAEFQVTAVGQSVFNVFVNGAPALTNFDIFAAAGGEYKAVVEDLPATADANGQVTIEFEWVSGDWALVNGIEVHSGDSVVQTINAGLLAGGTIAINPSNFTNQGTLQALHGESMSIGGVWSNAAGATISADGATLNLGDQSASSTNAWTNAGTVSAVDGSTVNLGGEFTLAGLGSFSRSADSTVNLVGTLDNRGAPATTSAPATAVSAWAGNGDATDSIGGNNGTLVGGASFIPGISGQAFSFDGKGQAVSLGNPANLQLQNFTIEAWVQRDSDSLASNDETNGPGGVIFGYGVGGFGFGLFDDGELWLSQIGSSEVQSGGLRVTDSLWHHVAVTVDNGNVIFYVDGVATPPISYAPGYTFTTNAAIGASGDNFSNSFLGNIELLSVDDQALDASTIASLAARQPLPFALDASTGSWNLAGGTIVGGTITTSGGAALNITANSALDGVTVDTDLSVPDGQSLTVLDGLTLNGTLAVGQGNLFFDGTQSLAGTGQVALNSSTVYLYGPGGPTTLTVAPGMTIHGAGQIADYYGDELLDNQGTIEADVPGGTLTVSPAGLTNEGTLAAINGGTLSVPGVSFDGASSLNSSADGTVIVTGNLLGSTTDPALFTPEGTTILAAPNSTADAPELLEAMSDDRGPSYLGFDPNFAFGTLEIDSAYVQLVDQFPNSGSGLPEAVYANLLVVPAGDTLDLNGLHLYVLADQIDGTVINGEVIVIPLTVKPVTIAAVEGATFSGTVATFTDSQVGDTLAATITWDDGTTTSGTISGPDAGGIFTVTGNHLFTEETSGAMVSVVVSNQDGASEIATSTANVSDAALTGGAVTIAATEGATFSGTVATFTDADPNGALGDYSALIDWGDGALTAGTITTAAGGFAVSGAHTFADEGTEPFTVTIYDVGGSSTTVASTADVADAPLTGSALTITAENGVSFNSAVATFTDANPAAPTTDFTATIDWGDGSSSAGSVTGTDGTFTVAGTHTYPTPHNGLAIVVTISDVGGADATVTSTANVAKATLAATAGAVSGTEGATFSGAVATFTDAGALADFSAVITWDDGSQSAGTITGAAGHLTVAGTHVFGEEGLALPVTIAVSDTDGESATVTSSAAVADAALDATGLTIAVTEGTSLSVQVATFTDVDPAGAAADYTAKIVWGDGATTAGTITTAVGGGFAVTGSHAYAEEGTQSMTVTIADVGGNSATTTSTADIADATLTATRATIAATESATYSGPVASFTDADPAGAAADYTATIVWGDGATAAGSITTAAGGGFAVIGAHAYAEEGTQSITVTIADAGGSSATATSTADIADTALSSTPADLTPPVAIEGAPFSNVTVFHFTDADPNGAVGDYTATVTPGDGNTVTLTSAAGGNGQIVAHAGGGFDVQLSYTYAEELTGKTFGVSVADTGGASTSQSINTFVVADAALSSTPANLTPPVAIEGAPFSNVTVFHFTDADPNGAVGDYTATVTLGDGNTVTLTSAAGGNGQIVAHAGGGFDVQLSYTYAEELSGQTFGVSVADAGGASTSQSVNTFSVADAALSSTPANLTPPVAIEGAPFSNVTVFHFTDADPNGAVGDYTATVTLGDGNTVTLTSAAGANGQIVAHAGGGFDVQLSYTYAEELSGQTFGVSVADAGGASTSQSINTFSVADAALSSTPANLTPPVAIEGAPFSNVTVFHFTDADPNGAVGDYTATVTLGDGNTVTLTSAAGGSGQIVAHAGGGFDVQLSYTYAEELSGQTFGVSVADAGGASTAQSINTFSVADAALSSTPANLTPPVAIEEAPFSNVTVFHFTDADPNGAVGDYTATVTLGDGNTLTLTGAPGGNGQIVAHAGGGFDVQLSYTYAEELTGQTFGVSVADAGGASTSQSINTFSVADAALSSTPANLTPPVAIEGAPFSNVTVFHFMDADPNGAVGDYMATVTLGDGNTVTLTSAAGGNGQIVAHAGGGFDVQLSYTYAEELTGQTFGVSVADAGGASTSQSINTFSVADAALSSTPANLTPPVAIEGAPFSNVTVFHFTDADPNGAVGDFTATVTLGDGNTVTLTSAAGGNGQIVAHAGGGFDVQLSYTYAEELSNQTFGVSVADAGGASTSQSINTFSVADAALSSTPANLTPPVAIEGAPFSNVTVFHFTDSDPNGAVGDYTATVTLGDGNTVTLTSAAGGNGQIVAHAGGGFDVQLSYTYAEELTSQTFGVSVADAGGANTSQSINTFSVADAALSSTPANLTPPVAIEGAPFSNVTVFHFTDADPNGAVGDYTATVTLGDGNTVTLTSAAGANGQIVAHAGGGFDVQLSYTYAEELSSQTFGVSVADTGGASTSQSINTFSVADAALSSTPANLTPPVAIEGAPFSNVTVFHFTDADPNGAVGDFTATVTLGDGNTVTLTSAAGGNGQIVAHAGGGFDVQLSYTYAEELSNQTFGVSVADTGGASTSQSINTFSVADAALSSTPANLTPPVAIEGAPFSNVTVFHFTDSDPNGAVGDYTATVTLGDGNTVTLTSAAGGNGQIVAHAGGGFDVQLSYTYAEELTSQTFGVSVADAGGANTSQSINTFSVADAALSSTPANLTPPVAIEGAPFSNVTVFHFTDADPNGAVGDYTATVTLGDGNTVTLTSAAGANGQIVAHAGGGFDVQLSYTYAEELSSQTFGVSVADTGGASTSQSINTFSVADAALSSTPANLTPPVAIEGAPFSNVTVFHFTDADPNGALGDYTATVTLGDGNTVTLTSAAGGHGQIVAHAGGGFDVQLSYTYVEELSGQTFGVSVADAGGASTSQSINTFSVADAALSSTPANLTPPVAIEGAPFSNVTVFHFTDADPNGVLGDYTATVTLGDGNTVTLTSAAGGHGQIVAHAGGGFDVQLSYTYAEELTGQTFGVSVADAGGASTSQSINTFSVADAALSSTPANLTPPVAIEGAPFSNVTVFHFSDADPNGAVGDYTATVTLGDGNTVTLTSAAGGSGQIVAHAGGGFDVQLSYTYAEELTGQSFGVSVADAGGASTSQSINTFSVADAALSSTPANLTPPVAIEGAPFSNVTVFHFSDADPNGAVGDYTATVTLGDGNTVTLTSAAGGSGQIVAHAGGGFDVQLSYTYAEELTGQSFGVSVADAGGASTSQSINTFSVADAALSSTPANLTPPVAIEGAPFSNVTVFHFTDADPHGAAGDFTATVTLGDGNMVTLTSAAGGSGQIVAHAGGGFDVQLSYTYAEELTSQTFGVSVADAGGASTSQSINTFSVADAALSSTPANLTPPVAIEGAPFSNVTVFHFTDSDPNGAVGDYTATVTLGDGNTVTLTSAAGSNGQIVAHAGGGFDVQLSYTYAEELTGQTFGVSVADAGGASTSQSINTFSVADAALSSTPANLTPPVAIEGAPFSNVTVFHFTDSDPNGAVGDYMATVTLGDGNTVTLTSAAGSNGQIVAHAGGGFDVQLSYTYAEGSANKTFSVLVSDSGGANTSQSVSNFAVTDLPLSSTPADLTPPLAIEGAPFSNVTVFHFTDADPNGAVGDYTAMVTLGDGNTVTLTSAAGGNGQIVADAGGGFDVQLSYTYAEELRAATFGVSVVDAGAASTSQSVSAFSVADAALFSTPADLTPPLAVEGAHFSNTTVFHFTDADPNAGVSDYTAVVTLGDGNMVTLTSAAGSHGQIVTHAGGGFDVQLSYTYAEEMSGQTFGVSVVDTGGANTSQSISTFAVADPSVLATPATLTAVEGASQTFKVATFTDPGGAEAIGDYSATIDWGDGTVTNNASISFASGVFTVSGTHIYVEEGAKSPIVTLGHDSTAAVTTTASINVSDPSVIATPATLTAVEGTSATFNVATFTDPGGAEAVGDYSATIDWGDGTVANNASISFASGVFSVSGTHIYVEEGAKSPVVTITHDTAAPVTTTAAINVSDPSVLATPATLTAVEGASTTFNVATFTDPGGPEAIGDYSATIDWGDGTVANNASISFASGVFTVSGTHTYAEEGAKSPVVTITHDTAAPVTTTAAISVSDPSVLATPATLTAVEGASATFNLATFTDPGGPEAIGDYSATIDWGDGTVTNNASISFASGVFTVSGTHAYAEEGAKSPIVTLGHDSAAAVTTTAAINVSDPSVIASPASLAAVEGASQTVNLATFTDPGGAEAVGDYSATIDWGDGTVTNNASISFASGVFTVSGTHTYAEEGAKSPVVTITHDTAAPMTTTAAINVSDPSVIATPASLTAVEGASQTFNLATFTDPGGAEAVGDYSATIDWGDGTITNNASISVASGVFTVSGTHAYADEGAKSPVVTITHDTAAPVTTTAAISVSDPSAIATPASLAAVEGASQTFNLATFTDPGGAEAIGDYSATIDWGDSTITNNASISVASGAFTVSGTHTYVEEGAKSPIVTLGHDSAAAVTTTAAINVSDPSVLASPATLTTVEGTSATFNLATFTDPGGAEAVGDYSATIDWGDGTVTNNASISFASGVFTVSGTHTYAEENAKSPVVTITHDTAAPVTTTAAINVSDPSVIATPASLAAVEGASQAFNLATFTDPGGAEAIGDYSATIDWGDSTITNNASISVASGAFTVSGTHTYVEEGAKSPVVTITHDSSTPVNVTASVRVSDAALTGVTTSLATGGVEGVMPAVLSGATFTDANLGAASTDFSVTAVNWGDGGTSTAGLSVTSSGGNYTVGGSHLYVDDGVHSFSITVKDVGGSTATVTGSANVADAPLTGVTTASAVGGVESATPATLSGATFTDANVGAPVGDFSVTAVDWGDGGSSTAGLSVTGSDGNYTVSGSHLYTVQGVHDFSILVKDAGGSAATINGSAIVASATSTGPTAVPDTFVLGPTGPYNGSGATSVLANDTSADGKPQDLTAKLVTTASNGTLTLNPDGSFTYTPGASFQGIDRFSYQVSENGVPGNTVTVTLLSYNASLVDKLYQQVLHRSAEDSGLLYWTGRLDQGQPLDVVATGIFNSTERLDPLVTQFYEQYLNRDAEPSGLAYWVNDWQTKGDPRDVVENILDSQEFFDDAGNTNTGYISLLYQRVLQRDAEPSGLAYWLGLMSNPPTNPPQTRLQIASQFYDTHERHVDLVDFLFGEYFQGVAPLPDTTPYVTDLDSGETETQVEKAIIDSSAYSNNPPEPAPGTLSRAIYPH